MVTVYTGHRRTLFLPGIISLFIMCIGINRNNSLVESKHPDQALIPAPIHCTWRPSALTLSYMGRSTRRCLVARLLRQRVGGNTPTEKPSVSEKSINYGNLKLEYIPQCQLSTFLGAQRCVTATDTFISWDCECMVDKNQSIKNVRILKHCLLLVAHPHLSPYLEHQC